MPTIGDLCRGVAEASYRRAYTDDFIHPQGFISRYPVDPDKLSSSFQQNGHVTPDQSLINKLLAVADSYGRSIANIVEPLHAVDSFNVQLFPQANKPWMTSLGHFMEGSKRTRFLWELGVKKLLEGVNLLVRDGIPVEKVIAYVRDKVNTLISDNSTSGTRALNQGLSLLLAFMKPELILEKFTHGLQNLHEADKSMFATIRDIVKLQSEKVA